MKMLRCVCCGKIIAAVVDDEMQVMCNGLHEGHKCKTVNAIRPKDYRVERVQDKPRP